MYVAKNRQIRPQRALKHQSRQYKSRFYVCMPRFALYFISLLLHFSSSSFTLFSSLAFISHNIGLVDGFLIQSIPRNPTYIQHGLILLTKWIEKVEEKEILLGII